MKNKIEIEFIVVGTSWPAHLVGKLVKATVNSVFVPSQTGSEMLWHIVDDPNYAVSHLKISGEPETNVPENPEPKVSEWKEQKTTMIDLIGGKPTSIHIEYLGG